MQAAFDELNALYFGGRLSHYRVEVGPLPHGSSGRIDRPRRRIRLAPGDEMRATLLHEMAHAATNGHHGPRFKAEVERLRQLGAPVAEADCALLRGPLAPMTRALVVNTATDALCDHPGLTFAGFLRWFAWEYAATSQAAVLRRWPWIRGAFREAKANHLSTTRSLRSMSATEARC